MDYLDFDIRIEPGDGQRYPVRVEQAPDEARPRAAMEFPFDEATLRDHLDKLKVALSRSESTMVRRKAFRDMEEESEEQLSVRAFGNVLFEAAFPEEIRACYNSSLEKARASGKGLRLRLHIEAPDLATLPWEYLYDEERRKFVCLARDTPVVRYLRIQDEDDARRQPIAVDPPLRILGMVAAPTVETGLARLDVEREKRRIEEALAKLGQRERVELVWLEGQTSWALQEAMQRGPWHAFHFIGHGGFDVETNEGFLVFAKEDGREHRIPAPKVATYLTDHLPLRLVVLNACQGAQGSADDILSSTASTLILRGIPAVVAMQYKISDLAAIEFAQGFYGSLANGLPVDAAVAEARKKVNSMDYTVEWGTPVLHMQSSDGRLFDLNAVPPLAAEPAPEATVEVEPGIARSAVAAPAVAPASARGGRGGVLRWAGIFAGVVAGVVALLFVVDLVQYVLFIPEEEIPAEVLALMSTGGYERYGADAEHAQRLAETIVGEGRALLDQGYTQSEARIFAAAGGQSVPYTILARPGYDYEIRSHCGEGCQNLALALADPDGFEDPELDDGRNPILTIGAVPHAMRYHLDIEMVECSREAECLGAYSVYRKETDERSPARGVVQSPLP